MDLWKHGTYVDMWSIVHFLSGFLLAGFAYKLDIEVLFAAVVSCALLLLWEIFEWVIKIIEPSVNVFIDLVIGMAGFGAGASLFYYQLPATDSMLYGAILATAGMAFWGFFDFYKKGYR